MRTCKLIFRGEYADSINPEELKQALASHFQLSESDLLSVFNGQALCLKDQLTEPEGKFFQQFLGIAGILVHLYCE
ncbi:hypothetical protein QE250_14160 [Chromatiaceae bacterium AAb-1]|nr:hypothetical protein [Chromatiaceae bacterium AAb-1]